MQEISGTEMIRKLFIFMENFVNVKFVADTRGCSFGMM